MALIRDLISITILVICASSAAFADKRVALVIGNGAYANAPTLANPRNDAADMAAALRALGFTVIVGTDLTKTQMDRKILEFASALSGADAGVFHYSGHGLQVAGVNYLVPVDAELTTAAALDFEMVRLDLVQRTMEREAKTNILFLDACRNNPLARNLARALGTRAMDIGRGLAPAESGVGTLISFSTQPGNVALDGTGRNSPYSGPLVKAIGTPGEDILSILTGVRNEVLAATNEKQVPWENHALRARYYFNPAAPAPATPQPPLSEAARAWADIKDLKDVAVFEAFRKQYGPANALYDTLATRRIAELTPLPKPIASEDACEDGLLISVALPRARPCIKPGSGESFKDCPDCPEMVVAPAGSFTMGSPENEPEREHWHKGSESPQHEVTIGKPFAVGKFAVTRGQFAKFVKAAGYKTDGGCHALSGTEWKDDENSSWRSPGFEQGDDHPVVCVSWDDASAYVAWLAKTTGQAYRLHTEGEREYAARAGTTTPFWWGSSIKPEQANYNGSMAPYKGGGKKGEYRQKTMPVKSFQPNPWGLYQVHGNVLEWVEDCWHVNYSGAPADGSAWTTGESKYRVLRGGSWNDDPQDLRAACRISNYPTNRDNGYGLRVARTLNP